MRSVLMISRYFPPMFDVGGKRAYRFARYLPEFGWRAVVLTGRIPSERPSDVTPLRLGPETRVERRYEPAWFREPRGRPSDGTIATPVQSSSTPEPTTGKPRRKLLGFPIGPDIVLAPHVIRAAVQLGRAERVDAVFATSSPYAVLVEGLRVARKLARPLCLDLRDPWTLNFFQQGRARWAAALDRRIEQRLFEQADRVILNCETTLAAYRELYPHLPVERLAAIRNAFDADERPPTAAPSGPIRLLHFGNCYGPRRLDTVLRAIAEVRRRRPDAPPIVLENLGRIGTADLELAAELGLADAFVHGVFVPLEEGLARLAAADLALLVAYGEETLYIPAKLYDYLLARAPIACIAPLGEELATIVETCKAGRTVAPGDVAGMVALIEQAIDARARGERAFVPDEQQLERYSARASARLLASHLDAIAG